MGVGKRWINDWINRLGHFHFFFNNSLVALPISPSVIALFIAYLFDLKYAPSTVNTSSCLRLVILIDCQVSLILR